MSILIKGMKMPEKHITLTIFPNGYVAIYDATDSFIGETKAFPVPQHGKLIDGDIAEGIYFTEEDENGKDFCDGILYAVDWISKQPTIIPASEEDDK